MSSPVAHRVVKVSDKAPMGFHMRPVAEFVRLAMKFPCDIEVVRDAARVDGKSTIHMLTLAAEAGTELRLEARGEAAEEAVETLARFIENGFVNDETECQSKG
jgi:phosphocarrier protein HPr